VDNETRGPSIDKLRTAVSVELQAPAPRRDGRGRNSGVYYLTVLVPAGARHAVVARWGRPRLWTLAVRPLLSATRPRWIGGRSTV